MKIIFLSDSDILAEEQTSSVAIRQLFFANLLANKHKVTVGTTFGIKKRCRKKDIQFISGLDDINIVKKFDAVFIELSTSLSSIAYKYSRCSFNKPTVIYLHYAIIFEKLVTLNKKDEYNIEC